MFKTKFFLGWVNILMKKNLMFTSSFTTNGALMVQAGLASFITIGNSTPFEYNSPSSKIVSRPLKPKLTANYNKPQI